MTNAASHRFQESRYRSSSWCMFRMIFSCSFASHVWRMAARVQTFLHARNVAQVLAWNEQQLLRIAQSRSHAEPLHAAA